MAGETTTRPGSAALDAAANGGGSEAASADERRPAVNGHGDAPVLTVLVPTRNESANVETLVGRLQAVLAVPAEILFVDDSTDDTPLVVSRLARHPSTVPVRLIHRAPADRVGGLGGAVVAGLRASRAEWVCVIDGDLQHPPERVADLLARAERGDADVVVASRYTAGGRSNFGIVRGVVSRLSNVCARILFPRRLRDVTDPMSGFFLFRRAAVTAGSLRPRGFKILLEILARTPGLRVAEVPFSFGDRHAGESKASVSEGVTYLGQLVRLRLGETPWLFSRFTLAGASGVVVNMAAFAAVYAAGAHYLVAAFLATQVSTLWLYVLTDRWVFAGRANQRTARQRLLGYLGMNNAAFVIRGPLLIFLVGVVGANALLANLISLLALTVARFALADRLIWKQAAAADRSTRVHCYDIHHLVTVESDVALPELERFRVPSLGAVRPTVRVTTGTLGRRQSGLISALAPTTKHLRYDEGLGRLGFAIDIAAGTHTSIVASPLLRHSPHVLYTNVVEPVLRWSFVRRGFALVHAACISVAGKALLVTAQTDTGKTTTILKTLDAYPCRFLSDDLTLLSPTGQVLAYPKPLTVSRHTVGAVRTPSLTRLQRLGLPLQSRIHSRSGRRFALLLTRTRLPVATINAVVQFIVPPPKYDIEKLVPTAEYVPSAELSGLVVIERDHDEIRELSRPEAVEMLLRNCEDAYGFAPYPAIAGFLHGEGASDLHTIERSIVESGLAPAEATLIGSSTMNWWQRLPLELGVPVETVAHHPTEIDLPIATVVTAAE